jgi:hypothetical protein
MQRATPTHRINSFSSPDAVQNEAEEAACPSSWLALFGTMLIIAFVLIRAASFHHIDRFIGSTVLGFRWNGLLEWAQLR